MAREAEAPIRVAPASTIAKASAALRMPPEAFTPTEPDPRPATAAAISATASVVAPPAG